MIFRQEKEHVTTLVQLKTNRQVLALKLDKINIITLSLKIIGAR